MTGEAGDCCMARHQQATPPWSCDCPCHTRIAAVPSHAEEDAALLARAHETIELLQRAVKLGYSITLAPEQLAILVRLLGEAVLQKERR